MHFDHQRVRSGSNSGERHLRHELAEAKRVSWVDNYRQMRFRFQNRNRAQIERVTSSGIKRADAAFAQDHVRVALVQDVFRAHDQIINRGAESALQQHRKPAATDLFQKRKIVHVTRADLKAIRIFFDHRQIARVHDFGHDRQTSFRARFGEKPKSLLT